MAGVERRVATDATPGLADRVGATCAHVRLATGPPIVASVYGATQPQALSKHMLSETILPLFEVTGGVKPPTMA